jgi:hypothetical protein
MGKEQTEVFRKFVESKKGNVSDVICPLNECADKLEILEDYFLFRDHEDGFDVDERMANGLGHIVGDVKDDLRLIIAEMMVDVDKDVAAFRLRRAQEEKKEKAEVNA